jgi:hypothetical protein
MSKRFSTSELQKLRNLGLDAMMQKLARGFNYYSRSVEQQIRGAIVIPVKFGHRDLQFLTSLEQAVASEFKGLVQSRTFPRTVIYQWLRSYHFPQSEESIRIYDVEQQTYLRDGHAYATASDRLIAEGEEMTVLFKPAPAQLVPAVHFLMKKGSFYLVDDAGLLIPTPNGSTFPFQVNPERINDNAYMTPMIITTHDAELEKQLPSFSPVQKLCKMKGEQEISTYVDKTLARFQKHCRIRFEAPILRLANRLFKDFINYEEDLRLT